MSAQETNPALDIVCILLTAFWVVLLLRVIVSWAQVFGLRRPYSGPASKALDLLDDVTEPVLKPLRAIMPPLRAGGVGLDLSVLVAFVILIVLQQAFC